MEGADHPLGSAPFHVAIRIQADRAPHLPHERAKMIRIAAHTAANAANLALVFVLFAPLAAALLMQGVCTVV